jgi:hypothetical protein
MTEEAKKNAGSKNGEGATNSLNANGGVASA